MAAGKSPHTLGRTADRAVLANGFDEVLTARWMKAAPIAEERRKCDLVPADEQDEQPTREVDDPSQAAQQQ
jgi:hypothetical protein